MNFESQQRSISFAAGAAFAVALAALLVVAMFPYFPGQFDVHAGDTASRTLRSPRKVSFESNVLTEQRRDEAANAVPPSLVFDGSVRSRQLSRYDETAAEIDAVRRQALDDARKRERLAALELSARSVDTALTLPEEGWIAAAAEGRRVLEQILGVSLDDSGIAAAKDGVDAQIGEQFDADEALLAAEMARPLVDSTLRVDEERTEQNRQAARATVAPERINLERDDVIVDAGSDVDAVAVEKLRAAGVLSRQVEWRNVAAVAILAVAASAALAGYLYLVQPGSVSSERHLIALALITAAPALVAKFYLPLILPDEERYFLAFILPLAAAPILVAALLETDVAAVISLVSGALVAFISVFLPDASLVTTVGAIDTMRLLLVYGTAPLAGILLVHGAERLNRYLTAGIGVGIASYALLLAVWFIDADRQTADLGWMALSAGVGGIGSGLLAAGAFVTVGVLFGVTTRVQLMELSQLNAPLLRRLQDEAPGTFHHSIIVGNLAERAADLIGADALLTRVGCYYHDIGKVLQPGMYVENQESGASPHEAMTPEESATVIQQHVSRGLELARRSRLPARVRAFIPEHHGTRLVAYFYREAAREDPGIDPEKFQYPGPRPQSRETAIVMLADSTEALIRSSADRSAERIDQLVEEVIADRVAEGQLDASELTLGDLRTVAASFKTTMRAVYHPRVQYPEPSALEKRRGLLRLPRIAPAGQGGSARMPRRRRP